MAREIVGRPTKKVKIGGLEYELTKLGAKEGRRIWLKLSKLAASPVGLLAKMRGAGEHDTETIVVTAIAEAVKAIDDETAESLYDVFGPMTRVNTSGDNWPLVSDVFDDHFAKVGYVDMSRWLWESIVFNFASFLEGGSLGKMIDQAMARAKETASRSQTASTGSSGES